MKKIFSLALLLTLAIGLTSCTWFMDEKTKVKEAMVDSVCNVAKPMMDTLKTKMANVATMTEAESTKAMAEAETMSKDAETKMVEAVKKYGFKDKADFETISKKYEADTAFKEEMKKAITDKCQMDAETLNGMFQ